MNDNHNRVEHFIRKFSFERLMVNPEPLELFEQLQIISPQTISDAQKPELLAAAIIYLYLKKSRLNGKGGISAKEVAHYFSLTRNSVSQKSTDIEYKLFGIDGIRAFLELHEYIDIERYEVNELYYEFLESKEASDPKESIKALKKIIKQDPDFFDPYITLYEYYLNAMDFKNAIKIMEQGNERAMKLIYKDGAFPDKLNWLFLENRHIIRLLFNYACFLWANELKDAAIEQLLLLLKSNTNDNIGARYAIAAIVDGFASLQEYEERFLNPDGYSLDIERLEEWFYGVAKKHKKLLGWWIEL